MKKLLIILFTVVSLGMSGCIVEEEEMPYIPSEDEIALTASLEEDADYYIFTTDVQYLNSKVNSGSISYYLEFDKINSFLLDELLVEAKEGTTPPSTANGWIYYENIIENPEYDYHLFSLNAYDTRTIPGKDRENLYCYSSSNDPQSSYTRADTEEKVSREYPFVYTKYWIPKNQDFRLDTLAIVIEHRDYTGSNSTKSVYKEIPFVHTMEGTAE